MEVIFMKIKQTASLTIFKLIAVIAFSVALIPGTGWGALKKGASLPSFSLPALNGVSWSNKRIEKAEMGVLFFFSTSSKSCLAALKQLQEVKDELRGKKIIILAVGKQDPAKLKAFAADHGFKLPILSADKATLSNYDAQFIFPTTYVIGPEGKVTDTMQGGGAAVSKMLLTLADRQLQRKDSAGAEKLYRKASKQGDSSGAAKSGIAYSLLKQGKLAEAESTFKELAGNSNSDLTLKGKEGLSQVYLKQGKTEQALSMAEQVIKQAPKRSGAQLVKGQVYYQKGNKKEAVKALEVASASDSVSDFGWQKSEAKFANGNLKKEQGDSRIALASYEQAVDDNPYFVEALSNQGVALQDMGNPEKAMEVFSKVKKIDPNDKLVHSLLRQAQAAIAQKQDLERQKYIDGLVSDLLTQFKENKKKKKTNTDDWTTPPMVISILGFQNNDRGILMGRAGLEGVLQEELTNKLLEKNVRVVERAVLDKLLAELKLGSSDLTDPNASLKLGKIMAARLIATGSFFSTGKDRLVTMRLINTETTGIAMTLSEKQKGEITPTDVAGIFAGKIRSMLDDKFPLKGRLAYLEGDTIIINLGSKHGLANGTVFKVVGEGKPIELNGRILGYMPADLGLIKVVKIDNEMAYASKVEKKGDWAINQKIIVKK
jgi:tetratricopeptide (TPR) repeat protein